MVRSRQNGKGWIMAARAIASGTINFSLVSVPITLYAATHSPSGSFNLRHGTDTSRRTRQHLCTTCRALVARSATANRERRLAPIDQKVAGPAVTAGPAHKPARAREHAAAPRKSASKAK
jgi:hypothetical protein